jgi:hypothetical protein
MRKNSLVLFGIVLLLLFQNCQKNNFEEINIDKNTRGNFKTVNNNIFPTKKLQNPYSVKNMKKAMENLFGKNESNKIKTSHYYIRFKPNNEKDLAILENDTILELYDYPLDYEPYESNNSFHDPRIPENQPTYLYASVKKDYQIPNVDYVILEDLYIPELDPKFQKDEEKLDKLVYKALKITNNLSDTEKNSIKSWLWQSKWRPAGRILVWDDIGAAGNKISYLNLSNPNKIPVERAKVRARRWFRTLVGYTKEKGYFRCNGLFRRPANYSIVWETNKFDIRNGTFGQAYYNGPKIKGRWNLTITGGKSLRYATIFRAACRYQYWNIGGLKRPNVWSKIKYCYYHRNQANNEYVGINWGNWDFTGALPNIRIFGKSYNTWLATNQIYSITIHETAHASHIELMNAGEIQFLQVSNIIIESWADAVQWYITKIEYNWLGNSDYDDPYSYHYIDNHQNWTLSTISNRNPYTPLLIDLVDNYNQRIYWGTNRPNDPISGYTMGNLEQRLKHVYGLSSLKTKLKENKPNGVTNTEIDNQLALYFNL